MILGKEDLKEIDKSAFKWAEFLRKYPIAFAMVIMIVSMGVCTTTAYYIIKASYEREITALRAELKRLEKKDAYYENRKRSFQEVIKKKDSLIDFLHERDRSYLLEQLHGGKVSIKAKP